MTAETQFPCTRCGLCCRNVRNHELYRHLDRGDDVCRNLIETNNLCSIYQQRPPECQIDSMYDRFYSATMSQAAYYEINLKACNVLAAEAPAYNGPPQGATTMSEAPRVIPPDQPETA